MRPNALGSGPPSQAMPTKASSQRMTSAAISACLVVFVIFFIM
jgi:hypothetical protein